MNATKIATHTPGPWEIAKRIGHHDSRLFAELNPDAEDGQMVTIEGVDPDRELANARLIAAAPDLLEACRKIVALGGWTGPAPKGFTGAWESALVAIAKAKGAQS